jgi:mRNA interferase MazF
VRVRLDPVEGSEQGGTRPALIISPDIINEHCPVVLLAAITSKKTEKVYPFEVLLEPPEAGLTQRSKVLLMQLRSVDKQRLAGLYGEVSKDTVRKVEEALKVATGLTPT